MYRQGDVLVYKVEEIPEWAEKTDNRILAWGEATGHHHSLVGECEVYELKNELFFYVADEVVITHQEHDQIVIPAGTYKSVIQREYDPVKIRRVLD